MASSFNISVGADTSKLERDIQLAASRLRKPIDIKVKDNASSALGNITGKTTKFNDALDAATARVVAFGAAAGAFNLVRKGIEELLRSTVEVEASLARININLNETQDGLKQFSKNIFDIARNTGQTFETAAKAAEELARQGLTATETTTRLRDALILSRLAAIDSDQAVNSLTASINSFSKEALSSTEILNKLAAVDAKFAVSTADLANAISRVGSSASEAGVSFDELLGIVTSVQQTTARGGAVIGNSLKTIFTRIERSSTLDDLEALGIGVRDIQGKTLPAIQILTSLAKTYDTLSNAQKSAVAEQVGGVFQINILKAALGDLSKEYSIYQRALQTASEASDEAFRKNDILNQTLSASFNELRQSITQLFAEFGKINISPFLKAFTESLTSVSKFLAGSDIGQDAGKSIGENIMQGIGNVLTGPGVVALAAIVQSVIGTLARKVGAEFGDAVASSMLRAGILGGTVQAGKIAQVRKIVPRAADGLLPSVAGEMASINSGIGGATRSARPVVIPNFNFGGGKRGPVVANTDEYMVPNFAGTGGSAIFNKNMVSMYGLPRGAKKLAEGYVPNFAAIYRGVNPKFGDTNAGINSIGIGNKLVAAVGRGNYTDNKEVARLYGSSLVSKNIKDDKLLELASYSDIIRLYDRYLPKSLAGQIKNSSGTEQLRLIQAAGKNLTAALLQKGYSGIKAPFAGGDNAFLASKGMGGNLFIPFADGFIPNFAKISAKKISGELEKKRRLSTESGSELEYLFNPKKKAIEIDHIRSQKKGDAFQLFTALTERSRRSGLPIYSGVLSRQYGAFDPKTKKYNEIAFNSEYSNYENLIRAYPQLRYRNQPGLKNFFNMSMVDTNNQDETFYKKFRSLGQAEKFVNNISKWDFARYFRNDQFSISGLKTFAKAGGYVPNFANPLGAAIARERAAGIPSSQIYIDRDRRVINKNNPLGLLIANRNDEPLGGHQGVTRMLKQGRNPFFAGLDEAYDSSHFYNKAKGYVPNFALTPQESLSLGGLPLRQGGVEGFIKGFDISKINFDVQERNVRKQITKAIENSLDIDISKLSNLGKKSYSKLVTEIITTRAQDIERIKQAQIAQRNASIGKTGFDEAFQKAMYGPKTEPNIPVPFTDVPVGQRSFGEPSVGGGRYNFGRFNVNATQEDKIGRLAEARRLRELRRRARPFLPNLFPSVSPNYLTSLRRGAGFSQETKGRLSLGLAIAAPAAAAFVPQGEGGTTRGVIGGAAAGALQGAGTGALFGFQGAVAGAAIGGLIGAFSKSKKSIEEFSETIDKASAISQKNVQGLTRIVGVFEQLGETSDPKIRKRLEKNIEDILPDLTPEARSRIKSGFGTTEDLENFVSKTIEEATKTERIGAAAKATFGVANERSGGFSGFVRSEKLIKDLGLFGVAINEPIKRFVDFFDSGVDTKQAKSAGKFLGATLTEDVVKTLTTKSAIGAIVRGSSSDELNQVDISKLQDLVDTIGTVDDKFKGITVDETNFKGLSIQIKEAIFEFRNLKNTIKDVKTAIGAAPIFKNLGSFLGVNFGKEQGFGEFGRVRTYNQPVKNVNFQRDRSLSFLNTLSGLEGQKAFEDKGGLQEFLKTNEGAGLRKLYRESQGVVGKEGVLDIASEFIKGFEQFKTATVTTPEGKVIESAVVGILKILEKNSDKQTSAMSGLFLEFLNQKNQNLKQLGIKTFGPVLEGGYRGGEKLTTYSGTKTGSSRYLLGGEGGVPESAKEWLARGTFSANSPSRARMEFERNQQKEKIQKVENDITTKQRLEKNENPFESTGKELVSAIEKIKNLAIDVENAFKVSVVLSPDAVNFVTSENVAMIERQLYTKLQEIQGEVQRLNGAPPVPTSKKMPITKQAPMSRAEIKEQEAKYGSVKSATIPLTPDIIKNAAIPLHSW